MITISKCLLCGKKLPEPDKQEAKHTIKLGMCDDCWIKLKKKKAD